MSELPYSQRRRDLTGSVRHNLIRNYQLTESAEHRVRKPIANSKLLLSGDLAFDYLGLRNPCRPLRYNIKEMPHRDSPSVSENYIDTSDK